jgi:hypothetical protein
MTPSLWPIGHCLGFSFPCRANDDIMTRIHRADPPENTLGEISGFRRDFCLDYQRNPGPDQAEIRTTGLDQLSELEPAQQGHTVARREGPGREAPP